MTPFKPTFLQITFFISALKKKKLFPRGSMLGLVLDALVFFESIFQHFGS